VDILKALIFHLGPIFKYLKPILMTTVSTALTLFFVPALYTVFEQRFKREAE